MSDLIGSGALVTAPRSIRLVHSMDGKNHVFTSPDMVGLRIASPDLEAAFGAIEGSLGYLVGEAFGNGRPYTLNLTYREYIERRYARHRVSDEPVVLFAVQISHAHIHDPNADFVPDARRLREARRSTSSS